MDKVRVLFVLPEQCSDESQASDVMNQAYEFCKQNVVNVSWMEESKFSSTDVSKTDFVIFEDFKGKNFESLKENKCARILGPWCILVCLMEGKPIPNFTWPIYNVAMLGCVISCSHLPKSKKLEIKQKVQQMGGCYTDSLMSTNTHLITESVKSEKYLQAAESGLKLMTLDWVEAVWFASLKKNTHCDDDDFSKYKCLPFHNLTISSTGFPNIEMRQSVAQKVAKNGGIFTATLAVTKTDVLVVYGVNGVSSQKYKAARANSNIFCVTVDWIDDSIAKGYAVPHSLYRVVQKGTSTPSKEDEICPDFSIISAIANNTIRQRTTLEETVMSKEAHGATPTSSRISPNKRKTSPHEDLTNLVDGLDIKKAKRAGQYLDGCNVFVAGFKHTQREKLCKILNLSGATRYDEISDRLTHVIVGDTSCPEVKIIKSKSYPISLVSIHWLLKSIEKEQAADEENYLINLHEFEKPQFSSPLGQKGLSLLRSNKTLTSNDIDAVKMSSGSVPEQDAEHTLMEQYLKTANEGDDSDSLAKLIDADSKFNSRPDMENISKPTEYSTHRSLLDDPSTSQMTGIFSTKKFIITGFNQEDLLCLKDQIENDLGTVMPKSYRGIPDYVVTPMFITSPLQIPGLETVNNLWIIQCTEDRELYPIQYYHQPFLVKEGKPLENCIVTSSGYTAYEKIFLKGLIEELGGICQEQFARITSQEKQILASTHLISLEADGKKYNAALKWGLPVISKEWLFECAKSGQIQSGNKFSVGDSKTFSDDQNIKNNALNGDLLSSNLKSTPSNSTRSKRILTPLNHMQPLNISRTETPVNQKLFGGDGDALSQVTPINKLMEEVRKTNLLGTPQTPPMPKTFFDIDTPESPFGAFIKPHLSPKSKKDLMRYINAIPDFVPPRQRRKSTPLSEVKRRCWKKFLGQQESPTVLPNNGMQPSTSRAGELFNESQNGVDFVECNTQANAENNEVLTAKTNDDNVFINCKLQQIEDMADAFDRNWRSRRLPFRSTISSDVGNVEDSEPLTVGWDYNEVANSKQNQRIFILSGIDNNARQEIVEKIEQLGAQVSDLSSYDPKCTHLICPKPARNEKTLSCMASGKWILHISYVDKSVAAGKFLDEEEFEFGNPKFCENLSIDKDTELRLHAMYWWRTEISRRGYGAFNDMRAIVVAQKRESMVRVIEAGGGQVVKATAPFDDNLHATHCLLEVRSVPDFSVYNALAQQGILCLNTLYISDFLYKTNRDIKDAILPQFLRFYS